MLQERSVTPDECYRRPSSAATEGLPTESRRVVSGMDREPGCEEWLQMSAWEQSLICLAM